MFFFWPSRQELLFVKGWEKINGRGHRNKEKIPTFNCEPTFCLLCCDRGGLTGPEGGINEDVAGPNEITWNDQLPASACVALFVLLFLAAYLDLSLLLLFSFIIVRSLPLFFSFLFIVTGYGLDDHGSIPRRDSSLHHHLQDRVLIPPNVLLGLRWPRWEADCLPPSIAGIGMRVFILPFTPVFSSYHVQCRSLTTLSYLLVFTFAVSFAFSVLPFSTSCFFCLEFLVCHVLFLPFLAVFLCPFLFISLHHTP